MPEKAQERPQNVDKEKEKPRDIGTKAKPLSSIESIVSAYFELSPPPFRSKQYEFEVKFGTRGIRPLTKNDYTKLIKKLKSRGFECTDENGEYSLKIQHEFLDSNSGSFRMSDVRTEIYGIEHISNYCKTNDLEPLKNLDSNLIVRQKRNIFSKDRSTIYNFYNNDFNFAASLQTEQNVSSGTKDIIISNWNCDCCSSNKHIWICICKCIIVSSYNIKTNGNLSVQNT